MDHMPNETRHDETYNFRFKPDWGSGVQMLQRETVGINAFVTGVTRSTVLMLLDLFAERRRFAMSMAYGLFANQRSDLSFLWKPRITRWRRDHRPWTGQIVDWRLIDDLDRVMTMRTTDV